MLDWIIAHRREREAKIVEALRRHPDVTSQALIADVYSGVDSALHPIAERSLLAHLQKLEQDGLAVASNGRWQLTGRG
ncbi:MAG: hypothetical protein U5K76_13100 [Woeseiaceae bacterium]|nr:hypothetical protein [Woeseiaceae bacterium]